jgi:quinol-cytochrome oxidoreductase complex cytochrome b subunit
MATTNPETHKDTIPFYPDHLSTEVKVMIGIVVLALLVGVLGMLFPVGLQPPADPMDTPAHVKPEWYFLALYQLLKFIPKTIGALIPVLLVLMLALWPFFDRKQDTKKATRIRLIAVTAGLILLIALTIWGEVS